MTVNIEKTKETELRLVTGLLKDLYLELGEEAESISFLDEKLIRQLQRSGRTEIYLIKTIKQLCGVITLTESQAIYSGGIYGVIDEMYVLPSFRSQKIGSAVIAEVKKIAIRKNWKRIDVTAPTEEKWRRTVAFYESCGFVFTGPKLKYKL